MGGDVGKTGGPASSGNHGTGVGMAEPPPTGRVAAQAASSKTTESLVARRASILT
jgi:hypothetical protein